MLSNILMKKLFLTILFLTPALWCYERPLDNKSYLKPVAADFMTAFSHIKTHEGNYANIKEDRGGETYAGITRRWNPEWEGWEFIDQAKPLNQCDSVGGLVPHYVLDYYLTIWVREGFYLIRDQQTANYLLDFRINGTVGTKIITKVMKEIGAEVEVTNIMTEEVIREVNKLDKIVFLEKLKTRRIKFYHSIVRRDPSQKKFLSHWLYRAQRGV